MTVLVWIVIIALVAGATMMIIVRRRPTGGSGTTPADDARRTQGEVEARAYGNHNQHQQSGPM